MAKRFKSVKVGTRCRVSVTFDRDWDEYKVKTYRGKTVVGSYGTGDSKDARGTQIAEARWLRKTHGAFCLGMR